MFNIPCVIFAGGRSSRMGEDKALLPFGGFDTLTQFQLSRLSKIFKTVYISCKSKEKFDTFNIGDAKYIYDAKGSEVYAPTAGFVGVFETLKEDAFFALSVDAPFVSQEEISKLISHDAKEFDATIAKTEFGIEPMCGVYHRSLESNFKKMLQTNNHKLGLLLKASNTNYVYFSNNKVFLNLNKPQDYQEALNLI